MYAAAFGIGRARFEFEEIVLGHAIELACRG
jgi:hypothetical protein